MFEPGSRYYAIETVETTLPNGQHVAYKRRRILPAGASLPLLVEVIPGPGDRLDLIAHRTLGDPLQFWRICDANNAVDPLELLDDTGAERVLRIPLPQPGQ